MGKRTLDDVHGGQIWNDRDLRFPLRRVRVISVSGPHQPTVTYRVVIGSDNQETGSTLTSRYERFQRAFDLISDLPEGGR